MSDQWNNRDLPVLVAAVHGVDTDVNGGGVRLHDIASETRLTDDEVILALRALESDGLVEVRWLMPARAGQSFASLARPDAPSAPGPLPRLRSTG